MNDQRFFDLAMKAIGQQATSAERSELDKLLAEQPELKAEFDRLVADSVTVKSALALAEATRATAGEFPAYARNRLQAKVRRSLGPSAGEGPTQGMRFGWRWLLGLAGAAVVVLLVTLPLIHKQMATTIQVAVLDTLGGTRGTGVSDVSLLQNMWKGSQVQTFSNATDLAAWENGWAGYTKRNAVKIIYDRAAAEVSVSYNSGGGVVGRTFSVDQDLGATLDQVRAFLRQQGL